LVLPETISPSSTYSIIRCGRESHYAICQYRSDFSARCPDCGSFMNFYPKKGHFSFMCTAPNTRYGTLLLVKVQCCTLYNMGVRVLLDMCMHAYHPAYPPCHETGWHRESKNRSRERWYHGIASGEATSAVRPSSCTFVSNHTRQV
jgi:hypothetical protein